MMASFLSTRLKKKNQPIGWFFFLQVPSLCEPDAQSAPGSNLKAKRKRLNIVFATLFPTKQGVRGGECFERHGATMRLVSRDTGATVPPQRTLAGTSAAGVPIGAGRELFVAGEEFGKVQNALEAYRIGDL